MAATQQTQAIAVANQLVSLSATLIGVYQQMVVLDAAWTDNGVAAVLAAMKTTTLGADGAPGAADGAPNTAHPIDVSTYPALQRALSATQIGQLKTILDGIVSYVGGSAVSTQAAARPILNAAVG
jgi:hypothetical protein